MADDETQTPYDLTDWSWAWTWQQQEASPDGMACNPHTATTTQATRDVNTGHMSVAGGCSTAEGDYPLFANSNTTTAPLVEYIPPATEALPILSFDQWQLLNPQYQSYRAPVQQFGNYEEDQAVAGKAPDAGIAYQTPQYQNHVYYPITPSPENWQQRPLSNQPEFPSQAYPEGQPIPHHNQPIPITPNSFSTSNIPEFIDEPSSSTSWQLIPNANTNTNTNVNTLTPPPLKKPIKPQKRPVKASTASVKTIAKAKKVRRSGPLDARTKAKAEEMRDVGACWRCKKYKKPCSKNEVCESCQVPGFRIWPSELGCRRERLESLVLFLIPSHMESKLQTLPPGWKKSKTWRVLQTTPTSSPPLPSYPTHTTSTVGSTKYDPNDLWALSKQEARSILIFGDDFDALCGIAERYQRAKPTSIKALQTSLSLLIATCRLYRAFVSLPGDTNPASQIDAPELMRRVTAVRNTLRPTLMLVQKLCLSTTRSDWFPAFLSACIATFSAIVFLDLALAIPGPTLMAIYPDFHHTRSAMRAGGYDLLVDLLRASTNGFNPLREQEFWATPSRLGEGGGVGGGVGGVKQEGKVGGGELKRVEERYRADRMILLGHDDAAREGLVELRGWREEHRSVLEEGRDMMSNGLFKAARIPAVGGLSKIFDF